MQLKNVGIIMNDKNMCYVCQVGKEYFFVYHVWMCLGAIQVHFLTHSQMIVMLFNCFVIPESVP